MANEVARDMFVSGN